MGNTITENILNFWEWFSKNELKLYNTLITFHEKHQNNKSPEHSPMFDVLSNRLKRVDPNLSYEFFLNKDDSHRFEFYISAGGIRESFPVVFNMVRFAPESQQFKFIPFKPAHKDQEQLKRMVLGNGDSKLPLTDIYFSYKVDSKELLVDIFIKNFKGDRRDGFEMTFYILDKVVGEYDVVTMIRELDVHKLTSKKGLLPIFELPSVIQMIKKEKNIPDLSEVVEDNKENL